MLELYIYSYSYISELDVDLVSISSMFNANGRVTKFPNESKARSSLLIRVESMSIEA